MHVETGVTGVLAPMGVPAPLLGGLAPMGVPAPLLGVLTPLGVIVPAQLLGFGGWKILKGELVLLAGVVNGFCFFSELLQQDIFNKTYRKKLSGWQAVFGHRIFIKQPI